MEKSSHLFLILFYVLSGVMLLSYLLIRFAITYRINTIREKLRYTMKTAQAVRAFHNRIGKISTLLSEKERLDTEELIKANKDQMTEFGEEIGKELSIIQHSISELEYKSRFEHRILWPRWAQLKIQKLCEEIQELQNLTREISQY